MREADTGRLSDAGAIPADPPWLTLDGRETAAQTAPVPETHEVMRLFTPAPAQIPGQLDMGGG